MNRFLPPDPRLELMTRFTVELAGESRDLGRTTDLGRQRIIPIVE